MYIHIIARNGIEQRNMEDKKHNPGVSMALTAQADCARGLLILPRPTSKYDSCLLHVI